MKPALLAFVIPTQAGIQLFNKNPHSGQNLACVALRASVAINWIPACAGMTAR
jgi:hypothetical protein